MLADEIVQAKALSVSHQSTTTHKRISPPSRRETRQAPLVLIADGDDSSRSGREQQLLAAGLRVLAARTSFEAIVKACCLVPDLILLDGALTDIDAAETGHLLTMCPVTAHIPVVRLVAGRRVPQRLITGVRSRAGVAVGAR